MSFFFGIIPYAEGSECRCNIFEFPWVFCLGQFFDCGDICTTGRDINKFSCRVGSNCAWSTGDGRGRCSCPDKCSDEDQREESIREKFLSLCPIQNPWSFPGPCVDTIGDDEWECGVLGNGYEVSGSIYQYIENGYASNPLKSVSLKTFGGEDITYSETLERDCLESGFYIGNRAYHFSTEKCFVCYKNMPLIFNETNHTLN